MNTGKLYFVIGLPRSGKTRYCEQWAHQLTGRVVVSGDAFRTALHGKVYVPQAEGTVFAMMDVAIRALLATGHDVIVDETSTTEQTVRRYLRIDPDASYVVIGTPADVCMQRAFDDRKPYLLGPIRRMEVQMKALLHDLDSTVERIRRELRERACDDVTV